MNSPDPLLDISNLSITFLSDGIKIPAVSGFSCRITQGTCTAIIGESGCGKSVVAHAILRLLPKNSLVEGEIIFKNLNIYRLNERTLQSIRGNEIGIMFQSPDRALNPIYRLYHQILGPLDIHKVVPVQESEAHIYKSLRKAGFSDPEHAARLYPCHCSGGMNQRAVTAIILSLEPDLVIADEPTKGLDRSRILDIQASLKEILHENRTLLLITHDIRLAHAIAHQIVVMYAGEIVEAGPVNAILSSPSHPYTRGLIQSLPENGFNPIPGCAPPLTSLPEGCRFAYRCYQATKMCHKRPANLTHVNGRMIRCHRY